LKRIGCRDIQVVWDAIKQLKVRGAPAIGIAAGYGVIIGIQDISDDDSMESLLAKVKDSTEYLATSRPTAVNLFWAVDRIAKTAESNTHRTVADLKSILLDDAKAIHEEDRRMCHAIGGYGADLLNAVRENVASNFIDDLSLSACRDPDIRFLLNNGFDYEFRMRIFGSKGTSTASNKMDKGFCVASDLPLANQNAIESRFEKVRHWPNGDRVDPRLVERVMGLFQVAAAKHEPPDVDGLALKTTNLEAEGLMLSFYMAKEQKNTIKQSKYWPQNFKGRILAKRCTSKASLAAITVGAVFRYSIEFLSNKEVLEHVVFTVSYPDCLLYNKKP